MTLGALGLRGSPQGYRHLVMQKLRALVQTIRWAEPHAYECDEDDE